MRTTSLAVTTSIALAAMISSSAVANIRITEWMYNGSEFIELTNVGAAPIDMTGWSFDDDSRIAGTVSLSAFGLVNPGQSVILSEATDVAFRTLWGLSASVPVIGGNSTNLGRNDEINIYDAGANLVDRLTYGDETFAGTIRTLNISGWTSPANLGTNNVFAWQLSVNGDAQNSYSTPAPNIFVGNPGTYVVPAPGALALLGLAGAVGLRRGSRRRA